MLLSVPGTVLCGVTLERQLWMISLETTKLASAGDTTDLVRIRSQLYELS